MKKEQIILIRILSVVAVLAAMTLVLILGAGNGMFQHIINNINNNVVDMSTSDASIYNLYYYKGLNTIYLILFSVSLFSAIIAIISILTRFPAAVIAAKTAAISMFVTGIYLLFARIMEGSVGLHRFIAGFYMDQVSKNVETAQLMGKVPVSGILLVILSILCFLLIQSSGINRIKSYRFEKPLSALAIYLPVLFGSIFLEFLREVLITERCDKFGGTTHMVSVFIGDYFFADAWMFNWDYVWFIMIVVAVLILLRGKINRALTLLITAGIPFVVLTFRSILYLMNPPKMFGYLTFDEEICNATELAFRLYMLRFILDVLVLTYVCASLLLKRSGVKKILITYGVNVVISIVGIVLVAGSHGLSGMYIVCIIADIITLVGSFYLLDIRRSHH